MSLTTFRVTLSNFRCDGLPQRSAGRPRNAFFKLNFDNFKTFESPVAAKMNEPKWEESVTFNYSTKFPDCLNRKLLLIEVQDKSRFGSNEVIGMLRLDLYTIATGPTSQALPLRDGRMARGMIYFDVSMVQAADVEVRLSDVSISNLSLTTLPGASLQVEVERGKRDGSSSSRQVVTSAAGQIPWPQPDSLFTSGNIMDVLQTRLHFSLLTADGKLAGKAMLTLREAVTFYRQRHVSFSIPLHLQDAGLTALQATVDNTDKPCIVGSLLYANFFMFVQMTGGLHTDAGITDGVFPFPSILMKPLCTVQLLAAKEASTAPASGADSAATTAQPAKSGGTGAAEPANAEAAGAGSMAPPPADGAEAASDTSGAVVKETVAAGATDAELLMQPLFPADGPPLPPITDRLFGGAPSLPACWIRRTTPAGDKVAFENLAYRGVETSLPVQTEYSITIPPSAGTKLGLAMEPNFSGQQRYGFHSGRRNSGYDLGAIVRAVVPDSFVALTVKRVRPGHQLLSINGTATDRLTFSETVALLRGATRPLVLRFQDPYAVPPQLAAHVSNVKVQAVGTYAGQQRVPNATDADAFVSTLPSTAAKAPSAAPKRLATQAQKTLNMALETLSRVDVNGAAAAAVADAAGADPAVSSAAMKEVAQVQTALSDPGFLRSLDVVITGVAPAPDADKEAAPAAGGAADASGGSSGGGTAAQPKVCTDNAAARRALDIVSMLSAVPAASKAVPEEVRAAAGERTKRMAGLGMFRHAVEAIQQRQSADFSGTAVQAVSSAMLSHGVAASTLGLQQSTLVVMKAGIKKASFLPTQDGVSHLMQSLVEENPDQDGEEFVRTVTTVLEQLTGMVEAGVYRGVAPSGYGTDSLLYMRGGVPVSRTDLPPVAHQAMASLVKLDRQARLLDEDAVNPAPPQLLMHLKLAIDQHQRDVFVGSVLLAAAAKLATHASHVAPIMDAGLYSSASALVALHPRDARTAEAFATLTFYVGRGLTYSHVIMETGGVQRLCMLARAWMPHCTNLAGTPCAWAPEGFEAEVLEPIVFPPSAPHAYDSNEVYPRLVRLCVNALINLACYRKKTSMGDTSVALIQRHGGVPLLGDILRMHLNIPRVVTAVLNCAANIAFQNQEVQLEVGATMSDAIILAGYQHATNVTLLSMALRAIGNLTNEDTNIYRAIGLGAVRMISNAMLTNLANSSLQTLAASVLINITTLEAAAEAYGDSAEEMHSQYNALMWEAYTRRVAAVGTRLYPMPADAAAFQNLTASGASAWSVGIQLVVEEGGLFALLQAMSSHSTDVSVVDTCLRIINLLASHEPTAVTAVMRVDLVPRILFAMRAVDFDVNVQIAGAEVLRSLSAHASLLPTLRASNIGHGLASALDTHKALILNTLSALSSNFLAASAIRPDQVPHVVSAVTKPVLERTSGTVLQLAENAMDTLTAIFSQRTAAAIHELSLAQTVIAIVGSSNAFISNVFRRAGGHVMECAATLERFTQLSQIGCVALTAWLQVPFTEAGVVDAQLAAGRGAAVHADRTYVALTRMMDVCTSGTGEADSPILLATFPQVARNIMEVIFACSVSSPVLNGVRLPLTAAVQPLTLDPLAVALFVKADLQWQVYRMLLAIASAATSHAVGGNALEPQGMVSRILLLQLFVFIDAMMCSMRGLQPDAGAAPDSALPACGVPAELLNPALTSVSAVLQVLQHTEQSLQQASVQDPVPTVVGIVALSRTAQRVVDHLTGLSNGSVPDATPSFTCDEAHAVFGLSMSALIAETQQMMYAAPRQQRASTNGSVQPSYVSTVPALAAHGTGAGAGAAHGSGAVGGGASPAAPHRHGLVRASSARALMGPLAAPGGVPAKVWVERDFVRTVCTVNGDATALLVYDMSGVKKVAPDAIHRLPLLAELSAADFDMARIGYIMVDGEIFKQSGFLKACPKKYKTVCLDRQGNTVIQLEFSSESMAGEIQACIAALQR